MLAGIAHSIIQSIFLLKDQIFLGISQQNFSASIKEFLGLPFYGNELKSKSYINYKFFYLLLGSPTTKSEPLSRKKPHQPNFNRCVNSCLDPKVNRSLVTRLDPYAPPLWNHSIFPKITYPECSKKHSDY